MLGSEGAAPNVASGGRAHLLTHAGGIGGWHASTSAGVSRYSMGMRQRLYARFGPHLAPTGEHTTGKGELAIFLLNRSVGRKFAALLRASHFCLAPNGDGWGYRISDALGAGCVPLVAQPLVVQPLEATVLDYDRFSARLASPDDAGEALPARLRRLVSSGEAERLRHRLHEVRPAFVYRANANASVLPAASRIAAQAYEAVLLALCRRAVELHGQLRSGNGCAALEARLPHSAAAPVMPRWFPQALVEAVTNAQQIRRERASGTTPLHYL